MLIPIKYWKIKTLLAFKLSDVSFIRLINVKMPKFLFIMLINVKMLCKFVCL